MLLGQLSEYVPMVDMTAIYDGGSDRGRSRKTMIGLLVVVAGTLAWTYVYRTGLLAGDQQLLVSLAFLVVTCAIIIYRWIGQAYPRG